MPDASPLDSEPLPDVPGQLVQQPAVPIDASLSRWAGVFSSPTDGALLPAHSAQCVGCGPDNPHGLHLVVRRDADTVVCVHTFDGRHTGAPGVAHGGAVATAFDDLFGFLLYLVGQLAVTRNLTVDYLAPVRLGAEYELRAAYGERAGRRLPVSATMTRVDDGSAVATAAATFVIVDIEHFSRVAQAPHHTGEASA